jgi:hypothetical protein
MRPRDDDAPEDPPPGLEPGSPARQQAILATVLEMLLTDRPQLAKTGETR